MKVRVLQAGAISTEARVRYCRSAAGRLVRVQQWVPGQAGPQRPVRRRAGAEMLHRGGGSAPTSMGMRGFDRVSGLLSTRKAHANNGKAAGLEPTLVLDAGSSPAISTINCSSGTLEPSRLGTRAKG